MTKNNSSVTLVKNSKYFDIVYRGGFIYSVPGEHNEGAKESMHVNGLRGFRKYVDTSKSDEYLTEVGRIVYDIYNKGGSIRRMTEEALAAIDETHLN